MIKNPSPKEIAEAFADFNVNATYAKGWNTRGRPWKYGLRVKFEHHVAGTGSGIVPWCLNSGGQYPFCNNVTMKDGKTIVLSTLSAWGSGRGGPWVKYGIPKDLGHLYGWQTEIETAGVKKDITDAQFETEARVSAALYQVAGWDSFNRIVNHKGWTNGVPELGIGYKLPTFGRKIDTLYDVSIFRAHAWKVFKDHSGVVVPAQPVVELPTVDLSNLNAAIKSGAANNDIILISKALSTIGWHNTPVSNKWMPLHKTVYTAWQKKLGYAGASADGVPGEVSLRALGSKTNLFKVVL